MKTLIATIILILSLTKSESRDFNDLLSKQREFGAKMQPDWWWFLNYSNCIIVKASYKTDDNDKKIRITLNKETIDAVGNITENQKIRFINGRLIVKELIYSSQSIIASKLVDGINNNLGKEMMLNIWIESLAAGERWIPIHPVKEGDHIMCLQWNSTLGDGGLELNCYIKDVQVIDLKNAIERKKLFDKDWADALEGFTREFNRNIKE